MRDVRREPQNAPAAENIWIAVVMLLIEAGALDTNIEVEAEHLRGD